MKIYQILILILTTIIKWTISLQQGERVVTQMKAKHDGYTSFFYDIPIDKMPHFRKPSSGIVNVILPQSLESGREIRLNSNQDLKISLSFAHNKLFLPWTIVFDASERKSLQKLIITFSHDDFDILRIQAESIFSTRMNRLDPTHPSLTAFEIEYKWKGIQEQDLVSGLYVLFIVSILWSIILFIATIYNYNKDVISHVE